MIALLTLIYFGGSVVYLYTRFFCTGCCSCLPQETEDNGNDGVEEGTRLLGCNAIPTQTDHVQLVVEEEEYFSSESSEDVEIDNPLLQDYSWETFTKSVPTFPEESKKDESVQIVLTPSLYPKSVRFHPLSLQHDTFPRHDYRRRNNKYFDKLAWFEQDHRRLERIYEELDLFLKNEIQVIEQPKDSQKYEDPDDRVEVFIFEEDEDIKKEN